MKRLIITALGAALLIGCGGGKVELTLSSCDDEASGWIDNTTDNYLDVTVRADFVDTKGALIDSDSESIELLAPGDTGFFFIDYTGSREYDTCHARVESAVKSDSAKAAKDATKVAGRPTPTPLTRDVDLGGTPHP